MPGAGHGDRAGGAPPGPAGGTAGRAGDSECRHAAVPTRARRVRLHLPQRGAGEGEEQRAQGEHRRHHGGERGGMTREYASSGLHNTMHFNSSLQQRTHMFAFSTERSLNPGRTLFIADVCDRR